MPCDTRLKPRQTIQDRAREVRAVVERFIAGIKAGRVKIKVGPQGAVAFDGVTDEERDGVTDACAFRRIMTTGDALTRAKIEQAEKLSGRQIDRKAIAHGHHSHDGGKTWHRGH